MPAGMDMSAKGNRVLAEAQSNSQAEVVLNTVSCTHEKCSQASVSVSAVGTDQSAHAVAARVIQIPVKPLRASYVNSAISPRKLTAISSLSIHLRI